MSEPIDLEGIKQRLRRALALAFDQGVTAREAIADVRDLLAEVTRFQLAVHGERQACAMIADNYCGAGLKYGDASETKSDIRDAILARGGECS